MSGETGFIQAIQNDLHDDRPRLIYADWLEERGDPRGEYLRLQCELRKAWSYTNPCQKYFARMASLRREIDPNWLVLAHRCTTPPPPVDVAKAVPQLKRLAKKTVCLHPRPGIAAADASKIGGLFLWPAEEEWPVCNEHECPLAPVLQLRKEDVPNVGFKKGTDLLHVLWCPHDHDPGYCPAPQLYWRKRAAIRHPST